MQGASNKWPAKGFKVARAKGFCIGWLIDTSALTLWVAETSPWITFVLAFRKIPQNPSEWPFFCVCVHLLFGRKKRSKPEWRPFFFGFHLVFGRKKRSNLSEDLFFFGDHHEIYPKTLVCEEDKVRQNFGPRNFWNSKFGPRLKKVGRPWIKATSLNEI